MMLKNSFSARVSTSLTRSFASVKEAPKVDQRQVVAQREREQKRMQSKRELAASLERSKTEARVFKELPHTMDVPKAMRYIRAAEVGRPAHATTISLQMRIVADKGVPKISGAVRYPVALKEERICVLTSVPELISQAKKAGAAMVGSDEIIAMIRDTPEKFDVDRVYATPEMMGRVSQVARILGPKGSMPTAKRGTVISNVYETIMSAKGETTYKQANDMLTLPVARASFSDAEVVNNTLVAVNAIRAASNSVQSAKKGSIGRTTLTSTNSPSISIIV